MTGGTHILMVEWESRQHHSQVVSLVRQTHHGVLITEVIARLAAATLLGVPHIKGLAALAR